MFGVFAVTMFTSVLTVEDAETAQKRTST